MEISLEEFTTQIFNKQTTPTASSSHLNEGTASFIDVPLSRGQAEGLGVVDPNTILHFCGGHTLYLLDKIRKCNLVATIQNLVLSDQIIYTGSSAGCMIVAPDLSVKKDLSDEPETWAKYLSDFTDYSGLDLVDFLIVPHFDNPAYSPYNQEYVANSSFNTPLLFLSDNQAVWVADGKFEIVTH